MATAVDAVFVGKEPRFNRRFLPYVRPLSGRADRLHAEEKGQVENQVGLVRERFFTPRLR